MFDGFRKFIGKLTKEAPNFISSAEFMNIVVEINGSLPLNTASVRVNATRKDSPLVIHIADCRWYRVIENKRFLVCENETVYHFSIDDVGARIQCVLKNIQGDCDSVVFSPIELDPKLIKFAQKAIKSEKEIFSASIIGEDKTCNLVLMPTIISFQKASDQFYFPLCDVESSCSCEDPQITVITLIDACDQLSTEKNSTESLGEFRLKFLSPLQRDKFVLLLRLFAQIRAIPAMKALRMLENKQAFQSQLFEKEIENAAGCVKNKFDQSRFMGKQLAHQNEELKISIQVLEKQLQQNIQKYKQILSSDISDHNFDRDQLQKSILEIESRHTARTKARARTERSFCAGYNPSSSRNSRPERSLVIGSEHARPTYSEDQGLLAKIQQNAEVGIENTFDMHASHQATISRFKLDETENSSQKISFFTQEFQKFRQKLNALYNKSGESVKLSKLLSVYLSKCENHLPELLEIENELLRERVEFLTQDLPNLNRSSAEEVKTSNCFLTSIASHDEKGKAIEGTVKNAEEGENSYLSELLIRQESLQKSIDQKEWIIQKLSEDNQKLVELCAKIQDLDSGDDSIV